MTAAVARLMLGASDKWTSCFPRTSRPTALDSHRLTQKHGRRWRRLVRILGRWPWRPSWSCAQPGPPPGTNQWKRYEDNATELETVAGHLCAAGRVQWSRGHRRRGPVGHPPNPTSGFTRSDAERRFTRRRARETFPTTRKPPTPSGAAMACPQAVSRPRRLICRLRHNPPRTGAKSKPSSNRSCWTRSSLTGCP